MSSTLRELDYELYRIKWLYQFRQRFPTKSVYLCKLVETEQYKQDLKKEDCKWIEKMADSKD